MDTGSNKNYIKPNLVKYPFYNKTPFYADSVGGKVQVSQHTLAKLFELDDAIIKFYLLPSLKSFDAIIGNDSLKELSAVIHTEKDYMTIRGNIAIKIRQASSDNVNSIELRNSHMTLHQKERVNLLTAKYPSLFSEPDEKLTYTTKVVAEIRTNTETPVYTHSYPYPMSLKDEVESQIQTLLRDGIIRPSRSPYNSPVWIVPKKSDTSGERKYRVVIDYRKLNLVTIPDAYPIPNINDVLSQLGESKLFTILDLKSGFHQIPLKDADIEKTAFSINNGKYEFTRLPFGLKNAPAIFQRALDDILREHIGKRCFVYIDDIIIFSKDEDTHLRDVQLIFETLERANMKVQMEKCEFLKKEVEFLGFVISDDGIKTNPKRVEAILKIPPPKTLKELRSFLGLTNFYRNFVQDYAKLAKPLTILLRGELGRTSKTNSSKIMINLDANGLRAFDKLKQTLMNEVILTYPDYTKEFQLTTDASKYAIGAVLSQNNRPITFISRTLTTTEEHYAVNEKEMFAIVWALVSLRNYLYGRTKIKIYTDHQPLTYALSNKNSNPKLKRWKAILEEYNYEINYKPGKSNVVADALSRLPQLDQINVLTNTVHSDDSSPEELIQIANEPINVFKNQLFLNIGEISSYQFSIVFPTYHRHIITEPEFTTGKIIDIFKRYLNPSVINGLKTEERILGTIQEVYPIHFSNYRVRFARKFVTDLINQIDQENEILKEHKRAHRNTRENKAQLLNKYYFPKMQEKIDRIVKQCRICKEQKYDRHPNNPVLKTTPIPQYPGHIVHIDIYYSNNRIILTAIDKFSKYAQAKIVSSRATEDIRHPLREILMNFGIPEKIVVDNEKSLSSAPIIHMLEDQLGIEIFKAPPYTSTVNGQIERFHSTLSEIIRCVKSERIHDSFEDLLDRSVSKYNYSIHSTTCRKPVELFFGREISTRPEQLNETRADNIRRLQDKQDADLQYHNRKRKPLKQYTVGQEIYVKTNKRIGNKLSPRYRKEIVRENNNSTIITESGRIIHKGLIRN